MAINFKPNGDKILIKPIAHEAASKNLEVIGNVRGTNEFKGEVVAMGYGRNGNPMRSKIGDIVVYSMIGAQGITIDKVAYVIMSEQDILGTFIK